MSKKTVTGGGKKPPSDGGHSNDNRFTVVDGEGDLPGTLPEFDGPKPAGIISPHGFVANRRAYTPVEPTAETLMKADHGNWVEQFSAYMSLDTGVPMTAFRQGAITRLHWAARYIGFLEKRNSSLQAQLAATERDLTRALAAVDAHSKGVAGVSQRPITTDQLAEAVYARGLDPPSREVLVAILEIISHPRGENHDHFGQPHHGHHDDRET